MEGSLHPSSSDASSFNCDDVIPTHSRSARTLVLCFDGTGDSFDADNSNVVLLFSMLKKDDSRQQMVYYQAGIGTYTTPEIATPGMAKISKALDMAIAWNMDAHVMDGYEFLMQNYIAGDKICFFGFSRGAYTARALAGMIHKVGLLPACNHQQVPFAYKMYSRSDKKAWDQSTAFKKAFSMDVDIEFIGVWDTVDSIGIIPRRLPFTSSNSSIRTFRHALSLDEHRAKFKAKLYQRSTKAESELGTKRGEMPKAGADVAASRKETTDAKNKHAHKNGEKRSLNHRHSSYDARECDFDANEKRIFETDVLEVWFSGCHTDVGGGSVPNTSSHNLARIPLRWMIRQCFLTNTGILFHGKLLQAIGLDPANLYPVVKQRPPALSHSAPSTTATNPAPTPAGTTRGTTKTLVNPTDSSSPASQLGTISVGYNGIPHSSIGVLSEEEEDLKDSLCRKYDQLYKRPLWWILEVVPLQLQSEKEDDDQRVRNLTINHGRPRVIPKQTPQGVNVHRSVKTRIDAGDAVDGGKYKPLPRFFVEPNWVD